MRLPRDFLDELDLELVEARRAARSSSDRVSALEELRAVAADVAARLGRPITVFDLIRSAPDRSERERRAFLARHLRS
jgi:hypothetical protein